MKLRLEISVSTQPVAAFEHDGPALHIGRDPACELALDATFEGVSWRHARIDVTPAGVVLCDLGSTNGTYVNDRRIAGPTRLLPGDAFRLGSRGPRLRLAAPEAPEQTGTIPDSMNIAGQVQGSKASPPSAGSAPPASARAFGLHQPDSDPLPTLAGTLTPLRSRRRRSRRPLVWLLVAASIVALIAAGVVLLY